MKLSLIVPCYNEQDNIFPFFKETVTAFQNMPRDISSFEIEVVVFVSVARAGVDHVLMREQQGVFFIFIELCRLEDGFFLFLCDADTAHIAVKRKFLQGERIFCTLFDEGS